MRLSATASLLVLAMTHTLPVTAYPAVRPDHLQARDLGATNLLTGRDYLGEGVVEARRILHTSSSTGRKPAPAPSSDDAEEEEDNNDDDDDDDSPLAKAASSFSNIGTSIFNTIQNQGLINAQIAQANAEASAASAQAAAATASATASATPQRRYIDPLEARRLKSGSFSLSSFLDNVGKVADTASSLADVGTSIANTVQQSQLDDAQTNEANAEASLAAAAASAQAAAATAPPQQRRYSEDLSARTSGVQARKSTSFLSSFLDHIGTVADIASSATQFGTDIANSVNNGNLVNAQIGEANAQASAVAAAVTPPAQRRNAYADQLEARRLKLSLPKFSLSSVLDHVATGADVASSLADAGTSIANSVQNGELTQAQINAANAEASLASVQAAAATPAAAQRRAAVW